VSILKSLQTFIESYEGIDELKRIPKVKTDQTDEEPSSYALAPTGNSKIITDIIGNKTYENNYMFLAKEAAANEVDRQDNHDFLEEFSDWLDDQNDAGNLPELPGRYEAESLEVFNAMLFDIEQDGTGLYQVQIKLKITKKKGA
jgi:hypothetical protein